MNPTNGYFIVSLDFELFWGVFDVKKLKDYKRNIENVRVVIPRLLELADKYNIKLSFATIGFLFAKNKQELLESIPVIKPTYDNQNFDPYRLIDSIGNDESADPYHYANSLIKLIQGNGNHEIACHTFSHYYVNEAGQTTEQFEEDLKAALAIAKKNHVTLKSIVFPRNQINESCLEICKKYGITNFRGTEKHWMFDTQNTKKLESPAHKAFRLLDTYINLSGYNTYSLSNVKNYSGIVSISSSKFFRPYSKALAFLESLRISRIKKGMSHAAKNNEVYHIWWHPHNFGDNTEANFKNLEQLFKHYNSLNQQYNFSNETMGGLAEIIKIG